MAPSVVKSIGKKKMRREKKEGAGPSMPVSGACEPRQRRRRVQRPESYEPGTYSLLL
jgi:hypothetical protein